MPTTESESTPAAWCNGWGSDALLKDPSILILDEPTIGLDPDAADQVLTLIRSLAAERGVTVLLCSHLLAQVQQVCHRIGIFARGRLVASGTVAELAAQHGGRHTVEVAVAAGNAEPILRAIDGVDDVQHTSDGWLVGAQHDLREHIAAELSRAGFTLSHLRQRPEELGTIYRRYFTEGHDGPARR